jgi:hypothetical protein
VFSHGLAWVKNEKFILCLDFSAIYSNHKAEFAAAAAAFYTKYLSLSLA